MEIANPQAKMKKYNRVLTIKWTSTEAIVLFYHMSTCFNELDPNEYEKWTKKYEYEKRKVKKWNKNGHNKESKGSTQYFMLKTIHQLHSSKYCS